MKAIDVLGNDGRGGAAADQFGDGTVAAVRLRIAPGVIGFEAAPPGLTPGILGGEEIREINRRHLCPDAARAAKIRDPRLGADASTGEDHRLAGPLDNAGELGKLMII